MAQWTVRTGAGSIPAWAGKPSGWYSGTRALRVYPRVGGETEELLRLKHITGGLSPRGRGNLRFLQRSDTRLGSIPAWAGKPTAGCSCPSAAWVYPRVGGETTGYDPAPVGASGLSPRGRGNHHGQRHEHAQERSIPAWAGKPRMTRGASQYGTVYPRVGGETYPDRAPLRTWAGLSPRGRGNLAGDGGDRLPGGSIPAWAGKPCRFLDRRWWSGVYPRVGGETGTRRWHLHPSSGLSPRGRGNPDGRVRRVGTGRSIPAWAGKPRRNRAPWTHRGVYPRVGGETSRQTPPIVTMPGLSPRGRGNRRRHAGEHPPLGSIPAWAGKPPTRRRRRHRWWVYPRVGGETGLVVWGINRKQGLSPRGRGNLVAGGFQVNLEGSIPAWAGKP